jgi:2-polyprenyl-6-methoxyphenol hydroxylase-like FAD-dependent oxidoreductase
MLLHRLCRQAAGANTSQAAVVHTRTLEVLESIGVADRRVRLVVQTLRFTIRDRDRVLVPVCFDTLPTKYPYALMISQTVTEVVLLECFAEFGGRVLLPDEGTQLHTRYLVGADGMRSTIREPAGIGFPCGSYDTSFGLADVRQIGNRQPPATAAAQYSKAAAQARASGITLRGHG